MDIFHGIGENIDRGLCVRDKYEIRVASKDKVLDVGGRNHQSLSYKRLKSLSQNPNNNIVSTDILDEYCPDIVDDICNTKIEENSFDAIYCTAILEHVEDYNAAIKNIFKILKPGGELFLYVPFFWRFHDKMDHHRFTFTELNRMLSGFSEHKIFLADGNGYGGVFWQIFTLFKIGSFPKLWSILSKVFNFFMIFPLFISFLKEKVYKKDGLNNSFSDYLFFYTHLCVNHGFCGWAKK